MYCSSLDQGSHPGLADEYEENEESLKCIEGIKEENFVANVDAAIGPVKSQRDDVSQPGKAEHKKELENNPKHLSASPRACAAGVLTWDCPDAKKQRVGRGEEETEVEYQKESQGSMEVSNLGEIRCYICQSTIASPLSSYESPGQSMMKRSTCPNQVQAPRFPRQGAVWA